MNKADNHKAPSWWGKSYWSSTDMGEPQDWLWSFKEQDLSNFVLVARFSIFHYFRHHGIGIGQYKVLDVQKGIGKLLLVRAVAISRVLSLWSHLEWKRKTKNSSLSPGDDFTSSRPPPISKCQIKSLQAHHNQIVASGDINWI